MERRKVDLPPRYDREEDRSVFDGASHLYDMYMTDSIYFIFSNVKSDFAIYLHRFSFGIEKYARCKVIMHFICHSFPIVNVR